MPFHTAPSEISNQHFIAGVASVWQSPTRNANVYSFRAFLLLKEDFSFVPMQWTAASSIPDNV